MERAILSGRGSASRLNSSTIFIGEQSGTRAAPNIDPA